MTGGKNPSGEKRARLGAQFGLCLAMLTLAASLAGLFDGWNWTVWNSQMRLGSRGTVPADKDFALLEIDQIPPDRPWPWARLDYALVLRSLVPYTPQSIVFDVLLNDRDTQYSAFDDSFANVVARFDRVTFAGAGLRRESKDPLPANLAVVGGYKGADSITSFGELLWPMETFSMGSAVGLRNLPPESSGRVSRVPLVFRVRGKLTPSLTLQAVAQRLGADLSKTVLDPAGAILIKRQDGREVRRIPVDGEGQMAVRFRVDRPEPWKVSFDNVLVFAARMERGIATEKNLQEIRRRQVWFGRTDGNEFENVQTALGTLPAVRVQMAAAQAILDEDYIRICHPFILGLLLAVAGAQGGRYALKWGMVKTGFVLAMGNLVLWFVAAELFRWFNVALPLAAFWFFSLGILIVGAAAQHWKFESDADPQMALGI